MISNLGFKIPTFTKMHKIVHFDLKGAPLKLTFIEQVFKTIKLWGATGVLLEWEDTFPYSGVLTEIGSVRGYGGDNMYSVEEVQRIFQCAKENYLEPIQLIQTIGHLEFVLKHPMFRDLREKSNSPAVLCPLKPQSQMLVHEMVLQALNAQPDAKYFHIGADEVWHRAICALCQSKATINQHGMQSLYLEYIQELAIFLKQERPELTILMWDDMLRSVNVNTLECYKLGELVQPVIWDYNVHEHFCISPHLWITYKNIFPSVWAGSAFKGANGSCKVLSPAERYMSNQGAWIEEVKRKRDSINFVGVILTGWSRYDHFATLCELLPVSMISLRDCLTMWVVMDGDQSDYIGNSYAKELPGRDVMFNVQHFEMIRQRCHNLLQGDLVTTWLNPWQIAHGYTSPAQLEAVAAESHSILQDMETLQKKLLYSLSTITGPRSADEWMGTYFTPLMKKVSELRLAAAEHADRDASVRPA